MNPRLVWGLFYVSANAAALIYCLATGELMGDGAGFSAHDTETLYSAFIFLSLSIVALYVGFTALCRVNLSGWVARPNPRIFGLALALLVTLFLAYVQMTGLFVAGSSERGGTIISALFVVFNVDVLFLVYYAVGRDDPNFWRVTLLWALSIIQRGWFAYIFILVALELGRMLRRREFKLRWLLAGALLALTFPFLDALKIFVRINPGVDLVQLVQEIPHVLAQADFSIGELLPVLYEKIIGRVQVVSHAYLIIENNDFFVSAVDREAISGFWSEGYFGLIFDRLFGFERMPGSAQYLASFIMPTNESAWNVNPSIVGWFVIYGEYFPLTLLYVVALCLVSVVLMQRLAGDVHARDALWFYWLIFLFPGWISQFASLVGALLVVALINAWAKLAAASISTSHGLRRSLVRP